MRFYVDSLVLSGASSNPETGRRIRAFDFSRRGINALRLLDENDGGTWRRAVFEDGFMFELCEGLNLSEAHMLGDSIAFSLVSLLSRFR